MRPILQWSEFTGPETERLVEVEIYNHYGKSWLLFFCLVHSDDITASPESAVQGVD